MNNMKHTLLDKKHSAPINNSQYTDTKPMFETQSLTNKFQNQFHPSNRMTSLNQTQVSEHPSSHSRQVASPPRMTSPQFASDGAVTGKHQLHPTPSNVTQGLPGRKLLSGKRRASSRGGAKSQKRLHPKSGRRLTASQIAANVGVDINGAFTAGLNTSKPFSGVDLLKAQQHQDYLDSRVIDVSTPVTNGQLLPTPASNLSMTNVNSRASKIGNNKSVKSFTQHKVELPQKKIGLYYSRRPMTSPAKRFQKGFKQKNSGRGLTKHMKKRLNRKGVSTKRTVFLTQDEIPQRELSPGQLKEFTFNRNNILFCNDYAFEKNKRKYTTPKAIKPSSRLLNPIQSTYVKASNHKQLDRARQLQEKYSDLQVKRNYAKQYEVEHGVVATKVEIEYYTLNQLQQAMQAKKMNKLLLKAVTTIQKNSRVFLTKNSFLKELRRRNHAASVIQSGFKMYQKKKALPILIRKIKTQAAVTIQSMCRGYLVGKHYQPFIERKRLEFLGSYFQSIRQRLLTASQLVIRYYWLQYRKKMVRRKEAIQNLAIKRIRRLTFKIIRRKKWGSLANAIRRFIRRHQKKRRQRGKDKQSKKHRKRKRIKKESGTSIVTKSMATKKTKQKFSSEKEKHDTIPQKSQFNKEKRNKRDVFGTRTGSQPLMYECNIEKMSQGSGRSVAKSSKLVKNLLDPLDMQQVHAHRVKHTPRHTSRNKVQPKKKDSQMSMLSYRSGAKTIRTDSKEEEYESDEGSESEGSLDSCEMEIFDTQESEFRQLASAPKDILPYQPTTNMKFYANPTAEMHEGQVVGQRYYPAVENPNRMMVMQEAGASHLDLSDTILGIHPRQGDPSGANTPHTPNLLSAGHSIEDPKTFEMDPKYQVNMFNQSVGSSISKTGGNKGGGGDSNKLRPVDILELEEIVDKIKYHYMLYTDASILKIISIKKNQLDLFMKHSEEKKHMSLVEFLHYSNKQFPELEGFTSQLGKFKKTPQEWDTLREVRNSPTHRRAQNRSLSPVSHHRSKGTFQPHSPSASKRSNRKRSPMTVRHKAAKPPGSSRPAGSNSPAHQRSKSSMNQIQIKRAQEELFKKLAELKQKPMKDLEEKKIVDYILSPIV